MKILIVEDDVLVALSMDDALSAAGHQVIGIAREEWGAIRLIASSTPDLALVDLKLAHSDSGALLARRLREREGIPCLFVSGDPSQCQTVGMRIGALGCLAKPFGPDELVEAIVVAGSLIQKQPPERVPLNLHLYFVT